jgi:hypothetical protein
MLIAINRMTHLDGTSEYINPEAIIRVEPLEYLDDGKLYEGSKIHLEGSMTVESTDSPEDIAKLVGVLEGGSPA